MYGYTPVSSSLSSVHCWPQNSYLSPLVHGEIHPSCPSWWFGRVFINDFLWCGIFCSGFILLCLRSKFSQAGELMGRQRLLWCQQGQHLSSVSFIILSSSFPLSLSPPLFSFLLAFWSPLSPSSPFISPLCLDKTYYKPTLSDNFCKWCPTFITFVFNIFLTYKDLTACSSMIDVLISSKLSLTKHIIFIQWVYIQFSTVLTTKQAYQWANDKYIAVLVRAGLNPHETVESVFVPVFHGWEDEENEKWAHWLRAFLCAQHNDLASQPPLFSISWPASRFYG